MIAAGLRSFFAVGCVPVLALALGSCAYFNSEPYGPKPWYMDRSGPQGGGYSTGPAPAVALPATVSADEVVGRWGLASYHQAADRTRTEAAARNQCRQPYVITRGPGGGVMMHLADATQPTELLLKGGPGGKNYIGPEGPAGDPRDREIVTIDRRVMVLRWVDPEVGSRYGTMVYARCGATPARPRVATAKGGSKRKSTSAKKKESAPKEASAPKNTAPKRSPAKKRRLPARDASQPPRDDTGPLPATPR